MQAEPARMAEEIARLREEIERLRTLAHAEKRSADEAARLGEERLRALMESATDLLAIFGPDATIRYVNPASAEVLGYPPGDLVGMVAHDLVAPEDRGRAEAAFGSLADRPGGTARVELRMRRRDGGTRTFDAVVRNLAHLPSVGGFVVSARDVTEQRRLQEQLHQAQKLESIGRLAGGVAHDFNNLLIGILGYADFLEEGFRAGNPSLEDLHEIRSAGEKARDLTRQLLTVARRQVIEPRIVDLNAVLEEAARLLRRVVGEDVDLAVSPGPSLWPVRADPSQLQQVLLNLAINARDAMPRGGKLTLETSNVALDDRFAASHQGVAAGDHVLLAVSDSGEGLSPEAREHLFEPFFTTKAGHGTGLGLATVYGIVKQAGGHVSVYSEPGHGTSFRIYLPRAEGTAAERPEPPPRPARGGHETVLVVEDDRAVRSFLVRTLGEAGYRVLSASSGAEALAVLDGSAEPVHLLVTDVVMPELGGRDLAESAAKQRRSLRVLFVSGYTQDAVVRNGVLPREVPFLSKPFTAPGLLAKVRAVLDGPGSG